MVANEYIIELPDLKYDKLKLKALCDSAVEWDNRTVSVDGKDTTYQLLNGDYINQDEYINELVSKFSSFLNISTKINRMVEIMRMPPYGGFDAHLDAKRLAVIIFPIIPDDPSPIYYAEGEYKFPTKILFEHHYTCPTIANSQILHGVRNDSRIRDTLQLSLMTTWEDLLKLNFEGKLLI